MREPCDKILAGATIIGVFYAISDQVLNLKSSQFQTKTNVLYLVLLPVLFAGTLNLYYSVIK